MTYEELKELSDKIEDVMSAKEDIDNLLEFQSKLVELETPVTLSFSFFTESETPTIDLNPFITSVVSANTTENQINMAYTEIDSRTCIRLITELVRYNENEIKRKLSQIKNERAADTVKEDKTA
jgi:hypothetical protein